MKKLLVILFISSCINTNAQKPTSPPAIRRPAAAKTTEAPQGYFNGGTSFVKDKKYYSADNRYFMMFQSDGNLVMYKVKGTNNFAPIWNTHTNGKAVAKCEFQTDGNLVLYDYTGKATWDAYTDRKNRSDASNKFKLFKPDDFYPVGKAVLVVQNDGNLVSYSDNTAVWNAGSFEKNN